MKRTFWIRKVAGFILMALAALLLFTYIVMTLWNSILTPVLSVHTIDFSQALGILVLSKILFGGFRGGGWGRGRHWNNEMRNKWQNMSPEEKEKFKQEWSNRCRSGYNFSPENRTTTDDKSGQPS